LVTTLAQQCHLVLSGKGRLVRAIPNFSSRPQQLELASAIGACIEEKTVLIAEAGTGTGKTFAYLIPALLSQKKTIISTATKTLQDQLFYKDLPLLIRALGLSVRIQNLKGRSNYLCFYRIALHSEESINRNPQIDKDLIYIREALGRMTKGERSELPEISEDSPVWSYATSSSDNCLGAECSFYQQCFLVKARKKAMESDVIVINHHLFFADNLLKEDGFGELLPGVETVVFDEAHQLAEIAAHFQSERITTRQITDLVQDILREWPVLDLPNQPFKQLSLKLDNATNNLLQVSEREERFSWEALEKSASFLTSWKEIREIIKELIATFENSPTKLEGGLLRCKERVDELLKRLVLFFDNRKGLYIKWGERYRNNWVLQATPYEIGEQFKTILQPQCSYIFTSATLTMNNSFTYFMQKMGLEGSTTLQLPSPFDFKTQALLYLPRDLPDPQNPMYYECLIEKVIPIINAFHGRCFFLFTSHRALQIVASILKLRLQLPILIQGAESKSILLTRFRELGNAVLLGTSTFWEGVDVKGEALSCVIIDKLPFMSPVDPVFHAKMLYLKRKGLSAFNEIALPEAVLTLKQGIGRLIRDAADRGVLMIADPRLTARDYGKPIFASLPPLPKTRCEQNVLKFIENLELSS
jgi:ATP-dependent DNA helicase DinG